MYSNLKDEQGLESKQWSQRSLWLVLTVVAVVGVVAVASVSSGKTRGQSLSSHLYALAPNMMVSEDVMARMDIVSKAMVSGPPDVSNDASLWVQVPGKLSDISVSEKGWLWGTNSVDDIFYSEGYPCGHDAAFSGWIQIPGGLKRISVSGDSKVVGGVNVHDNIYDRLGIHLTLSPAGTEWRLLPGALNEISAGTSHLFGVNRNGHVFEKLVSGGDWYHVSTAPLLKRISAGGVHVVGIGRDNKIYERRGAGWIAIPFSGSAIAASMGSDGEFWALKSDYTIYRRVDDEWVKINGLLKEIDVAKEGQVAGVNVHGDIFKYIG